MIGVSIASPLIDFFEDGGVGGLAVSIGTEAAWAAAKAVGCTGGGVAVGGGVADTSRIEIIDWYKLFNL